MLIISFKKPREFFENEPNAKIALQNWFKRTKKAEWTNFNEVKKYKRSILLMQLGIQGTCSI
jgi:mRNA-degrading endonuclease HigB of HigAB toxin-antitoxin module